MQLYLFEVWEDMRLNTSELSDDESISVPEEYTSCLWTPSLVFDGSTQKEQILSPKTAIKINSNNVLLRKSRLKHFIALILTFLQLFKRENIFF